MGNFRLDPLIFAVAEKPGEIPYVLIVGSEYSGKERIPGKEEIWIFYSPEQLAEFRHNWAPRLSNQNVQDVDEILEKFTLEPPLDHPPTACHINGPNAMSLVPIILIGVHLIEAAQQKQIGKDEDDEDEDGPPSGVGRHTIN